MMEINNNEIRIREFTLDDVEKKVEWINDPNNNAFRHYDIPLTVEKTIEWFKNKKSKHRLDAIVEYMGVPIGVIGLLQIDEFNKKAEFYITIGEQNVKRKGIATLATKMILEYAFMVLNLRKIYLNVDEDNKNACGLYEKVGFKCEGIFVEDMFFKGKWINRKRYALINSEEKGMK